MKGSVFTLRGRYRLLKTLHNVRVTLLCGLLTFIVLRSSLGAGKFGTPVQDYDEIRHHLHRFKLRRQQKLLLMRRELTDSPIPHKDTSRSTLSLSTEEGHVNNAMRGHAFDSKGFLQWFEQRPLPRRPRILLVTRRSSQSCKGGLEPQLLPKLLKNKIDYCRLHGIEIFYDMDATGTSATVRVLQELMLSHPKVEWIWWMDSFTMFTDMLSPPTLKRYAGYNVVHGAGGALSSKLNTWEKLWIGGSLLFRNCEWSRNYLENKGQTHGGAESFLDTRMEMYEPGVRNSEAWPPLITHYGSCSLCGNTDLSCLTHMERALSVADGQKVQVGSL